MVRKANPKSLLATKRSTLLGIFFFILIGFFLFFYRFGLQFLDPTNINAIFRGDPAQHYLGWLFFRNEPWQFPLGMIDKLAAPIGTNIGYTDSNPLLAIPLKLFSPLLPDSFQFIGLWVLLCYIFQGVFGFLLMSRMTTKFGLRMLGTGFFILSPPLLARTEHDTLCSHFLILAGFLLYSKGFLGSSATKNFNKLILSWSALLVVAGFIHPYTATMILGMALSFAVGYFLLISKAQIKQFVFFCIHVSCLLILVWYVIGYFNMSDLNYGVGGFGMYSTNLNAFINPLGWSAFLPDLPVIGAQYEGFAYLGLGSVILIIFALILKIFDCKISWLVVKYWLPLVVLLFFYFIFAISNKITFNSHILLEYGMPEFLDKIIAPFRSSGRFIWPVYYGLIALAISFLMRSTYKCPRLMVSLFVICLGIQFYDINSNLYTERYRKNGPVQSSLESPLWDKIADRIDGIIVYPPYEKTYKSTNDYKYLLLLAGRHQLSINTAYLARAPYGILEQYKTKLLDNLKNKKFDPDKLYLISIDEKTYDLLQQQKFKILDGYYIYSSAEDIQKIIKDCRVAKDIKSNFLYNILIKYRNRTVLAAVKDEASLHLSPKVIEYLENRGSQISNLKYRGSYAVIIHKDKIVKENVDNQNPVYINTTINELFKNKTNRLVDKRIEIYSAGNKCGNMASIKIGGFDYAFNKRGLNVVILDKKGKAAYHGVFDTHVSSSGFLRKIE